ncbi:hypothetical protein [Nocardia sp. NBC_01009]|uniref:hypothetical protein n=1 Tax=Nocardia sp. NBC_01009 TaxID=2975996 RepID=UPI00386AB799|nr:hypothetical protein OHA42_15275 [Nocardia sp. NBC_01009]
MTRCECVGGLIEADGPDAEVIDLLSFVVTCPARPADEPRNGASGLVPRGPAVEPYKYPPLTPKTPELGAIAKANPNDAAAQWAAYGVQY